MTSNSNANSGNSAQTCLKLNSGHMMPAIGFGTYMLSGEDCVNIIPLAVGAGYRHVDTAIFYSNEKEVGVAISQVLGKKVVSRSELFVTTKLWSDNHETGAGETRKAVDLSLKNLGLDYIDLYLIHSPHGGNNLRTYQELLKLQKEGLIRSVGVSNFGLAHMKEFEKAGLPFPSVNQIELHPWLQQKEIFDYCQQKGTLVVAYSPLTKGEKLKEIGSEHFLSQMAKKYTKSVAQVLLRWSLQTNHGLMVKSRNKKRIEENLDVQNWEISKSDIEKINSLEAGYHCTWDPTNFSIDQF